MGNSVSNDTTTKQTPNNTLVTQQVTTPVEQTSTAITTIKNDVDFYFIRHSMSCNNINMGQHGKKITKALSFVKNITKTNIKTPEIGKDFDPSIAVYGILETIKYAKLPEQQPYFSSNTIYVSNLLRTWITAFLLFGTNLSTTDEITLCVSPYLKEFHNDKLGPLGQIGNFPTKIEKTVTNFSYFLQILYTYCSKNIGDLNMSYYNNLPQKIILQLPPKSSETIPQKIIFVKEYGKPYRLDSFCNIEDTSGPDSGDDFTKTGDLQQFMEWFNSSNNYYKSPSTQSVYVVTHSRIMNSYLRLFDIILSGQKQKFDMDTLKKTFTQIRGISNSNNWHFKTTVSKLEEQTDATFVVPHMTDFITSLDIQAGVPILKDKAQTTENYYTPDYSLCGNKNIKTLKQTCKQKQVAGKKKTKRRYKNRINKSKRKHNKTRKLNKKHKV